MAFDDACLEINAQQFKGNKQIAKVIIGKNIERIGAEASSMCENIYCQSGGPNQWRFHQLFNIPDLKKDHPITIYKSDGSSMTYPSNKDEPLPDDMPF